MAEELPQGHPSRLLRAMMDKIPANPDGGLSMLNMIRSGLGTSANWLEGNPEIGPDTLAPLGIGTMGFGVANALTRASPDARIAQTLAKEYPNEVTAGSIHRGRIAGNPRVWVDGPDGTTPASVGQILPASNPTNARFVTDFGMLPGRAAQGSPANANIRGPVAVMADNARSSTPGLAANSTQQQIDAEKKRRLLDALMMGSPDA